MKDEATGAQRALYHFDGAQGELDVLRLSRDAPDERGGLGGAGAVPAVAAATRSVKLSAARQAAWAAEAN